MIHNQLLSKLLLLSSCWNCIKKRYKCQEVFIFKHIGGIEINNIFTTDIQILALGLVVVFVAEKLPQPIKKFVCYYVNDMQLRRQIFKLVGALQNRGSPQKYFLKYVQRAEELKRDFSVMFDKQNFLNSLSSSSIKEFLDAENIDVIEPFLSVKKELKSNYNFVIDEIVAKDIAEKVLSDCNPKKCIIAEGNPGLGLITINLVKSDIPHILLFDSSAMFKLSLSCLHQRYLNKITKHRKYNMNTQATVAILNTVDFSREKRLPWIFIGIATNFYFLRSLVLTSVSYKLWKDTVDVYLLLSGHVFNTLRNGGQELKYHVYCGFSLLYTIEEIARYPRGAFLPPSEHDEDMILIRIKSNQNFHEIIKEKELGAYFAFLRIIGKNRKNFIVSTLEKWLPGCGHCLIAKGISMTNQTRDLSPSESFLLFNFFKECDGYEDFKACISTIFARYLD